MFISYSLRNLTKAKTGIDIYNSFVYVKNHQAILNNFDDNYFQTLSFKNVIQAYKNANSPYVLYTTSDDLFDLLLYNLQNQSTKKINELDFYNGIKNDPQFKNHIVYRLAPGIANEIDLDDFSTNSYPISPDGKYIIYEFKYRGLFDGGSDDWVAPMENKFGKLSYSLYSYNIQTGEKKILNVLLDKFIWQGDSSILFTDVDNQVPRNIYSSPDFLLYNLDLEKGQKNIMYKGRCRASSDDNYSCLGYILSDYIFNGNDKPPIDWVSPDFKYFISYSTDQKSFEVNIGEVSSKMITHKLDITLDSLDSLGAQYKDKIIILPVFSNDHLVMLFSYFGNPYASDSSRYSNQYVLDIDLATGNYRRVLIPNN